MKWLTKFQPEAQAIILIISGFIIFTICAMIIATIQRSQTNELNKTAMELGLHQEVVDGKVVWVK